MWFDASSIDETWRTIYRPASVFVYRKSELVDPLSEVISLLRPTASYAKLVEASAPFRVRRNDVNEAFYCLLLSGRAQLEVNDAPPLELRAGDFVLIPAADDFTFSSLDPPPPSGLECLPVLGDDGIVRIGPAESPVSAVPLVGQCRFASPDAALLVSLLPERVVVRGEGRLATIAAMVRDEARSTRPARDVVLEHLMQVLLIEAFRSDTAPAETPGLVRGLADARIAAAVRAIHRAPERSWSVAQLADAAGLSRSAFFTRFSRVVGMAPMGYLLHWRMTLAKHMLRAGDGIFEISQRVGYGSSSAFSTAFTRHVGCGPARYAKTITDLPPHESAPGAERKTLAFGHSQG